MNYQDEIECDPGCTCNLHHTRGAVYEMMARANVMVLKLLELKHSEGELVLLLLLRGVAAKVPSNVLRAVRVRLRQVARRESKVRPVEVGAVKKGRQAAR